MELSPAPRGAEQRRGGTKSREEGLEESNAASEAFLSLIGKEKVQITLKMVVTEKLLALKPPLGRAAPQTKIGIK